MDDGSSSNNNTYLKDKTYNFISALKNDWALFWQSFTEDEPALGLNQVLPRDWTADLDFEETLDESTLEEIENLKKSLSKNRQDLHKKLELIHKEIDLLSIKLESLRLVHADETETVKKLNDLHDSGQTLTLALEKLDHQMKMMHQHQKF